MHLREKLIKCLNEQPEMQNNQPTNNNNANISTLLRTYDMYAHNINTHTRRTRTILLNYMRVH